MNLSLGFLVLLILIIFPGLIYRRLYFYGEFSKEFKSRYNLLSLVAIASIPGVINLIFVFYFYDNFFNEIDLGEIIDKFKELRSENFRFTKSEDPPIKKLLNSRAFPFIGFLYLTSFLFGAISGRLVRISKIDTRFKLLRFKNSWFYLFNGEHTNFKKMRHLRESNKKHVFTKADILVDSNSGPNLYSGIVVDYELLEDKCDVLSTVMLQDAKRYNMVKGKRESIQIAGNFLLVNCSNMKNINLTYVYEEAKSIFESKIPVYFENVFAFMTVFLAPFFIFKAKSIDLDFYKDYFNLHWILKILAFVLVIQIIGLLNPFSFDKEKGTYKYVGIRNFLVKLALALLFAMVIWIFS